MTTHVAVLAVRTTLFDADMSPTFRDAHERLLNRVVEALGDHVTVVAVEMANSEASALAASLIAHQAGADVILLVPVTAAPPHWASSCVPPGIPVVLWDTSTGRSLPSDANQADAHIDTASIGTIMAGGGLRLAGHHFSVVSATIEEGQASVVCALELAVVGGRLRNLRVLRIGEGLDGYSTLWPNSAAMQVIGLEVVDVGLAELASLIDEQHIPGDAASRSLALVSAFQKLMSEHCAAALAVNCHSSVFRGSEEIGVTGCLAASLGGPTACTSDVPTAWALALITELSGDALYCEPYTVDDSIGAVLLGNCGVGRISMARAGTWRELPSQFYPGKAGRGTSVAMAVHPGTATYVAVRPGDDAWDLVVIEGEVTVHVLPEFGGGHAFFQPAGISPRQMVRMLASFGVVHHGALGRGALGDAIHQLASEFLPIRVHQL